LRLEIVAVLPFIFFVTGKNVGKDVLLNVAKSIKNCTAAVSVQSLGWMPSGYSLMNHCVIADTVMDFKLTNSSDKRT
jgi:hypothetical protein